MRYRTGNTEAGTRKKGMDTMTLSQREEIRATNGEVLGRLADCLEESIDMLRTARRNALRATQYDLARYVSAERLHAITSAAELVNAEIATAIKETGEISWHAANPDGV